MYSGSLESVSNKSDWIVSFLMWDSDANQYIDITGCSIVVAVNDRDTSSQKLIGSTATGEITLVDNGTFQWSFPASKMSSVAPGIYDVGVTISQGSRTEQLFIGQVSILSGIVP